LIIKNKKQLIFSELNKKESYLRELGLKCLEKAILSVKPHFLINRAVKLQNNYLIINQDKYNLNNFKKIFIIGGGKATAEMAFSLEKIIKNSDNIDYEGIINIPEGLKNLKSVPSQKIKINFASHPIPNEQGLNGTKEMMEIIKKSERNDLIICLISGGGSALLPLPKKGITLEDLKKINSLLLASGASIQEINAVRKHLSDFKGGNLVKKLYHFSGAFLISLIISDVVGDHLDSIASGPTVPDLTTYQDSIKILKKYYIYDKIPLSIKKILEEGIRDQYLEKPKPSDNCFKNVRNYLIGTVKDAVEAIISLLKNEKFTVEYFSKEITGEARKFGETFYQFINKKLKEQRGYNKIALLGTGELTVTVRGSGIGGRNQEMLLSLANILKKKKLPSNFLVIGANLDGIEGNSKAMGAIVDNYIVNKIKSIDIEKYLQNNDSNNFFKRVHGEIITGPTGCNVNDIIFSLILK